MNNQDLAKIVRQVQKDKGKYFEKLFSEIYRTIYYLSFKVLNSEIEAQDVSQEIILCIYNHIEELKVPEGFNNWMNRIIYSRCANRLKQLSNRREEDYKEVGSNENERISDDTPERMIQTKEKNQFVLDIIGELPVKQREVILLYYYQQLSTPEIAGVLSCSIPSVQNRLHKAKKSIRNRIEKSKKYTTQQLFGVGGIPLLLRLLTNEANMIANEEIKAQLWTRFRANGYEEQPKRRNNKTNKVLICLMATVGILLFPTILFIQSAFKESTEKEVLEVQKELQLQPEVITVDVVEIKRIPMKNGNDIKKNEKQAEVVATESITTEMVQSTQETISNIQVPTEEKITNQLVEVPIQLREALNEGWYIVDISVASPLTIWEGEVGKQITNTAIVMDKDLEELEYVDDIGDRNSGESVYEEELYKKNSVTTYHATTAPVISFKKTSVIEQDVITYYLQLENIGEVTTYNIIVKDKIPEFTKLLQVQKEVTDNKTNVSNIYKEEQEIIFWEINQLAVSETVTLVFQVRVKEEGYKDNQKIRNIAYMKVTGKESDVKSLLGEEQDYVGSNEIIYMLQQQKTTNPKTGDMIKDSRILVRTAVFAVVLIICMLNQIRSRNNKK
jgi:RNA polymerase sigma factor, sigma-70 family